MYLDLQVVIWLGLGNVFTNIIFGQFGYLLFEWPMDAIINGQKKLK